MKAKNIFTKGFLLASVFALSGCSSFLDEKNWSSQSAEEYYATAEGYESLINGAYSTLKSVYNTTNYFLLTQLGTDLGTQNDGTATNALNQYTVDYTNDNGTVYNQWKVLYESLKNVNAAIGRAAMVVTKDQDIFDGIIKGFLPLGFTFIIYALLEKGMKSTTLLWGILILGIVLSFFGIL